MSERLAEAKLREIEARGVVAIPGAPMPPSHVVREDYRSLTADVRRLRGLIAAFADNNGYCCACILCDDSSGTSHAPGCKWPEVEAEAEAIRAENA
jgi:hypothetical protein